MRPIAFAALSLSVARRAGSPAEVGAGALDGEAAAALWAQAAASCSISGA